MLSLLNATWPALYGATGCPVFTSEYLEWLYGGPDRDAHLLLGCRVDGALVGLKAYLFRPLRSAGRALRGYLATHLTVAAGLPLATRIEIATEFANLHTLSGECRGTEVVRGDVVLAFFEAGKPLSRSMEKLAAAAGIRTTHFSFRHAIVNPRSARAFASGVAGLTRRDAEEADAVELVGLLTPMAPAGMALQPAPETFWRHISMAPQGRAFVVERASALVGFLACYVLDSVRQDSRTKVLVAEFIAAVDAEGLGVLLAAAVDYADACGARGVVIENTTCLAPDDCQQVGIMATPREMVLALRSKLSEIETGESFLCDIK